MAQKAALAVTVLIALFLVGCGGGNDGDGVIGSAVTEKGDTVVLRARADATGRMDEFARLEQNMLAFANAQAQRQGQPPPFQINVQVDGETVARATHNANSDAAARSFSPVPAY